jgi:FMN phosphatase YigB (HAD superfamily)
LFIDDLAINVKAAEQIGMKAIHFRGVELLKKELQDLGVLS